MTESLMRQMPDTMSNGAVSNFSTACEQSNTEVEQFVSFFICSSGIFSSQAKKSDLFSRSLTLVDTVDDSSLLGLIGSF